MYKTASCAEIAGNYLYHWINVTCEKVAKKWPKFKEIGTKNIKLANMVAKEKKILARTLRNHKDFKICIVQSRPI